MINVMRKFVVVVMLMPLVAYAKELKVEDPWVRLVPPVSANTAGYFRLCNGDSENALIGASSPVAKVVEIHTVEEVDGASGMRRLQSVPMAAASCTYFAPGGKHLMFIGLLEPLKKDQKVPVTLTFKNGETLKATFEVKKGESKDDHDHDHHSDHKGHDHH